MFIPYVMMLIIQNNQILLLKRCNTGFYDNHWGLVAGKIDANETATNAAVREAYEEVGISISLNNLKYISTIHEKSGSAQLLGLSFLVTDWQNTPHNKEENKHSEMQWFALDALPDTMVPSHKHTVELFKQNLHYGEFGW